MRNAARLERSTSLMAGQPLRTLSFLSLLRCITLITLAQATMALI